MTGEIGNGDRYKASGYINVPVGEKAAFRFAGSQQWFKGYWHNKLDGKQVGGTDETILRGSFRDRSRGPSNGLFRADYAKIERRRRNQHRFRPEQRLDTQWTNLDHEVLGAPDTNLNDNDMNQFLTADVDDEQWGVNSNLSWDIGGGSTVRLINNYRDWNNSQLDGDVIFTPTPIASRTGVFNSKSQNHELQFISPTRQWLDGRLDLVAGPLLLPREVPPGRAAAHERAATCLPNSLPSPPLKPLCNAILASRGGLDGQRCSSGRRSDDRQLRCLCAGELPLHRPDLRDGGGR